MTTHKPSSGIRGKYKPNIRTLFVVVSAAFMVVFFLYKFSFESPALATEGTATLGSIENPTNVLLVRTMPVHFVDSYEIEERYVGRVTSQRNSSVGFERLGRIATIIGNEGDAVLRGQPLATLSTDLLQARRKTAIAKLEFARAQYQAAIGKWHLTKATLNRKSDLLEENNLSRQLYDESVFEEESAEANAAATTAQILEIKAIINEIDVETELSTIHAPYNGNIVERFVDEGTTVAAGAPVLRLIETDTLEVRAGIPTQVASKMKLGTLYYIEIGDHLIEAPLTAILEEVDVSTHAVHAVFSLPAPNVAKAGQIASIVVKRDIPDRGFWIPITGLLEGRRGLWNAYALSTPEEGEELYRLSSRELKLIYNDATKAYVTGTFIDGEHFVATGLHRLVPDQLIRISQ